MSSVRKVAAVVSPELLSVAAPVFVRLPVFLELPETAEGEAGVGPTADGAGVELGMTGELDEGQRDEGPGKPPPSILG